jgi:very-short-patch-repair endonuclease
VEGAKFRRQQPIGPYIVDFVCLEKKVIIEVDGGHHNEAKVSVNDDDRAKWLSSEGYRVLRFWNNEVLNDTGSVMERIKEAVSPSL